MHASVVIPTVDRPRTLRDCLAGVLAQLEAGDEVIVVAQGTGQQRFTTAEAVKSSAAERVLAGKSVEPEGTPLIRVVDQPDPNLPAARNRGLREASAPVVVFLDDDAVPLPGWIAELLRPFDEQGADLVAGRLIEEPDLTTNSRRRPGAWLTVTGHTRRNYNCPVAGPSGLAPGGNMAVRREAALAAGGFDEELGTGTAVYEDTEFAERLRTGGATVWYAGTAAVEHRAVRRGGCWEVAEGEREIDRARNMSLIFSRHRPLGWPIMALAYIGAAKWKWLRGRLRWRDLTAIARALMTGRRAGRRQPVPLTAEAGDPGESSGNAGPTGGDRTAGGEGAGSSEERRRHGQE